MIENIEYIYFYINDKKVSITLNKDNLTTLDLLSYLPLTISFSDFNNTEKIGYLPNKLKVDDNSRGSEANKGMLNYYIPWGNLCFFYKDYSYSSSLVNIGKLTNDNDLSLLSNISDNTSIRIDVK